MKNDNSSTFRSMEEVNQECVELMGTKLGPVFGALDLKLTELNVVWQQYEQLFCIDEETVALLNRTAGLFFKIIQDKILDSVLLGISKMTDSQGTGGKKNLTILSLPQLVDDQTLKEELLSLCDSAKERASFARKHRNKRIAHQDNGYTTGCKASALGGINRDDVDKALTSIGEVLNCLSLHFRDHQVIYDKTIYRAGAEILVDRLREFEQLKRAASAP